MVDWDKRYIRPAAIWFSTPEVAEAFGAVLSRPYDPERAGITEAAIERRAPLLVSGIEEWPGAAGLRRRLEEQLLPEQARHTWDWYVTSSLLSIRIASEMINRMGISCKHLITFNMDEYANEKGETAPADWEGSFATSMRQSFFEKLDPKLRPVDKNIHFPTHKNIEDYWKMIEDAGGADCCYGGIGWCGHIAFWESHLGHEFGDACLILRQGPVSEGAAPDRLVA